MNKVEREREIEMAMNIIVSTLKEYKLVLTADLEREILVIVDATNNKKYGMMQVKGDKE